MPATTNTRNPFMGSVTVTTTAQTLYDLMLAIRSRIGNHASFIQIQNDVSSGGTTLYIGDSDVSSTNCGASLVGAQATQLLAFDSNLLVLTDIYIKCSVGTAQVNLVVVIR